MFSGYNPRGISRSSGYSKNKYIIYKEYKNNEFAKKTSGNKKRFKKQKDYSQEGSLIPTDDNISNNSNDLEMASTKSSNSDWVQPYEKANEILKELNDLLKIYEKEKEKRIKMQFGDTTKIDNRLEEIITQATSKIIECENILKALAQSNNTKESENDRKVRKNMQKALAQSIQNMAKEFRFQEKALYENLRKFGTNAPFEVQQSVIEKDRKDYDEMAEIQIDEEFDRERNKGIQRLVKSINELSSIFKQMNQLVIDQGTILDRIDYNIEQTLMHTKQGKKHLVKADKLQESSRGKFCMQLLLGLILIFTLILIIKYTN